jgi:hypothetical protein
MPWELGYFDGFCQRVAILPITRDAQDEYVGQEYLGIYPYVDLALLKKTQREILWVNRSAGEYGQFREWLLDLDTIKKRS